jgi:hypothetical protein
MRRPGCANAGARFTALVVRSHLAASFGHLQIDDAERYENPKAATVADHPAVGPKASCGPLLVIGKLQTHPPLLSLIDPAWGGVYPSVLRNKLRIASLALSPFSNWRATVSIR